jgi:hypothetical protein
MLRLMTGFLCSIVFLNATDLEIEKRQHENFWDNIIKDYGVETKTQANSRNRVLTELRIFEGKLTVEGTTKLTIEKALAPYVRNFSYLEFEGENLNQVKSVAYQVGGWLCLHKSTVTNPGTDSNTRLPFCGLGLSDADTYPQRIGCSHRNATHLT